MTPERWQVVRELFEAALGRPPAERDSFLDSACGGDEGLRREVSSLIEADARPDGLLDERLSRVAPELVPGAPPDSLDGRTLGPYRVEREIGRGGMGEVYLARDARLGRPVALKLLNSSFASDPERGARFEKEAQAVSHLNHPHIVTVYEVGEVDGLRFLVTEYVEGQTLREVLANGPLPAARALDIAAQVADALAAAHAAGVVHRDVKPENVMIRPDGHVKVLDFGLAKMTEAAGTALGGGDAATLLKLSTRPGLVMGTVSYMSPEQARGLKVDARTDVWSLGVVLYEMLTGRAPFEGETVSHVIVNILEREPEPLDLYAPGTPEHLQQLVGRALTKEREGRHASMREMLAELREAREEVTFRARQELHQSGGASYSAAAVAARSRGARRLSGPLLWAALLTVAAASLAFGVYQYFTSRHVPPPPPPVKMERVTANGKVLMANISPDGRYLAYAAGPMLRQSLWVMQVKARSHTQLVPPAEGIWYWGLTFSPDGEYVYYVKATTGGEQGELYRVPTLGGTPKRLLVKIEGAVTFSPDGRRIAFLRLLSESESAVVLANADGTDERVLATRRLPDYFTNDWLAKCSWSPDGETIACPAGNTEAAYNNSLEVVGVSTRDGSQRSITPRKWRWVGQSVWLGDGSGLILLARDAPPLNQIWHLSYPEGAARKLTNDLSDYGDLSLTADSKLIAALQLEQLSNIWVAPGGDAARARQVTDSRYDGIAGISWTPDGRVVYCSLETGNPDIFITNADGSDRRRLTDYAGIDELPSVSPDGRRVAFVSERAGARNIWRADIDGGNPVQLTRGTGEVNPTFSPDGRWVYYTSGRFGKGMGPVWKVPSEGGEPVLVIDKQITAPTISPDGKLVAYVYADTSASTQYGVEVAPLDGGPAVRRFPLFNFFRWTPDGRALAYVEEGGMNVWAQPIDGGPPRRLTDFKSDRTWWFEWSRDGKQLALGRGAETSDVLFITDFR